MVARVSAVPNRLVIDVNNRKKIQPSNMAAEDQSFLLFQEGIQFRRGKNQVVFENLYVNNVYKHVMFAFVSYGIAKDSWTHNPPLKKELRPRIITRVSEEEWGLDDL